MQLDVLLWGFNNKWYFAFEIDRKQDLQWISHNKTYNLFYEMFDLYCIQKIYRNRIVVTSSTFLHSLSYRLNAIWLEGVTSKVNLFDACWNVLLKKLYPRYLMAESFSFYYDCHHKISYNHMFKPRKSYTIQKLFHI